MKAPDKIYLSVEKGEDWAYAMWTQKTPEEQKFSELDEHEEYIRKDLLLEWAKAEIKLSKMVEPVSEISYEKGRQQVAKNLIEKLNSM